MIYAIVASEGMYQGSNGIDHKEIVQVRSLEEAHEIGTEMSIEVMNSYSFIYEELEEEIRNEINDKWTDKEIEKLRKEVYDSNVYYDLYELDEEKIKNISEDELEEEFYNDLEEFLDKYQKDEN